MVPYTLFHINNNLPEIITRLFSSYIGIAHLAFNILVLAYIGAYSIRRTCQVRSDLHFVWYCRVLFHSVIASYILGTGHVKVIGASGAISGVLGIAAATGNTSILLAGIATYIRHIWFFCRVSNCIHCAYRWLSCRSNSYQIVCNY
jgi:membrane associated rhomboid family serine protease